MNSKQHWVITATCAIIALWLLHLPLSVSAGVVILIGVLGVVAVHAKEDHPLKSYVAMYSKIIATATMGFLTLIVTNLILGIPVTSLVTWIMQGVDSAGVKMDLLTALELFLMVMSGWVGYSVIYGSGVVIEGGGKPAKNKTRRRLATVLILMTVITLWQVKAPQNPVGRFVNAQASIWTRQMDELAKGKESHVTPNFQTLERDATLYALEGGAFKTTDRHVEKGQVVLYLGETQKSRIGLQYRKVVMPVNDDYENGPQVWIDARAFQKEGKKS